MLKSDPEFPGTTLSAFRGNRIPVPITTAEIAFGSNCRRSYWPKQEQQWGLIVMPTNTRDPFGVIHRLGFCYRTFAIEGVDTKFH
jgi:hypothetical protein